ncbi:MAG TPA: FAD-binding oxidoreductase [Candidatus Saccharimonadaceae bacterium]|jgi:sarcosine oxidase subunit beta|nr:FAD-binding oxidoreductase [Candidatus Saccharimonadaceae bacterium]
MRDTADVVIVGGGVMGASVAYHLAARGRRDVRVLDRGTGPGAGSTGVATGGFRTQFATAIHVRLSLLAREKLLRFKDETGVDPGYVPAGYLWLATTEAELETLRTAQRAQRAAGLDEVTAPDAATLATLNPAATLDDVLGAAFGPRDGFVRPLRILEGYRAAAERLGVRFEWGREVTGVTRDGTGRVRGVDTATGSIACGDVVNAAGAWAGALGALAGVPVEVTPLRRMVAATVPTDVLPERMPMTIWVGNGFHLRVRDGRVLLLMPVPGVPGRPYDTRVDDAWLERVLAEARRRVPALAGVPLDRAACHAGLYEMTPDRHALLGPAVGAPNLWLVNGSCGHGVMHSPALGQLLAEMMCDGAARSLDVAALRPSRFVEADACATPELL